VPQRPTPYLTIIQPWIWAIENAGKRIENRNSRINWRGPLLLQAGKKYDDDGERHVQRICQLNDIDFLSDASLSLLRGFIILRVQVVGCFRNTDETYHDARDSIDERRPVPRDQKPWIVGPWCHLYERVERIVPIAVRGLPGYFYPKESLIIRKRR
jgi:hypothetical protein